LQPGPAAVFERFIMNKFAAFVPASVRKGSRKIATMATVGTGLAMSSMLARAQSTDPISTVLDSIDLSGVATKIAAVALLIVGIALVFKGPDIAKRVIRKV
jgi:hypothetical protein